MTRPRPRTAAEIAAAADRLATLPDAPPSPMPTAEVLTYLAAQLHADALDLWTLRDSIEANEPHPEHALAELPRLAAHLDAASRSVRAIADMLAVRLPIEPHDLHG